MFNQKIAQKSTRSTHIENASRYDMTDDSGMPALALPVYNRYITKKEIQVLQVQRIIIIASEGTVGSVAALHA